MIDYRKNMKAKVSYAPLQPTKIICNELRGQIYHSRTL